jgi:hypothetical protein
VDLENTRMKKLIIIPFLCLFLITSSVSAQEITTQERTNALIVQLISLLQEQLAILQAKLVELQAYNSINYTPSSTIQQTQTVLPTGQATEQQKEPEIVDCDSLSTAWLPKYDGYRTMKFDNQADVDIIFWDGNDSSTKRTLNTQIDGKKPGKNNPNGLLSVEFPEFAENGARTYVFIPHENGKSCQTQPNNF